MLKTLPFIGQSALAALPIVAIALSSSSASAAILAPGSTYAGKTIGEWSAEWWKYILSVPANQNPALDPTGVNANINQQGPVFFLAGTFDGTPVTRDITIPADKALLFPLINFVNISDPSNPETEEQLRVLVTQQADAVSQLNTSIDGTDIPEAELFLHREPSPGFSVTLPDGNIFGAPSGVYSPAVSDGYWLLLEPLSPGQHEISFGGKDGVGNYQDNTYNISVLPVPNAVPEPSSILGVTFGVVGTIFLRRRACGT